MEIPGRSQECEHHARSARTVACRVANHGDARRSNDPPPTY